MTTLIKVAVTVLCVCGLAAAQQQSLGEAAAAARRAKEASRSAMGETFNGHYTNVALGLAIDTPQGWEALDRGQINVNEAVGRAAFGLGGGVAGSGSAVVFMVHDGAGSSLSLSLKPVPAGETPPPPAALQKIVQSALSAQLQHVAFAPEPSPLLDAPSCSAFRMRLEAAGRSIPQSSQTCVFGGYVAVFVVTAPTPEKLDALMKTLKPHVRATSP